MKEPPPHRSPAPLTTNRGVEAVQRTRPRPGEVTILPQPAGRMFWFMGKRLVGSYVALIAAVGAAYADPAGFRAR